MVIAEFIKEQRKFLREAHANRRVYFSMWPEDLRAVLDAAEKGIAPPPEPEPSAQGDLLADQEDENAGS